MGESTPLSGSALEWKLRIEGDSLHHRGERAGEGKGRERGLTGTVPFGACRGRGTCQEKWGRQPKPEKGGGRDEGSQTAGAGKRPKRPEDAGPLRNGPLYVSTWSCKTGREKKRITRRGCGTERTGLTSGDPPASLATVQE